MLLLLMLQVWLMLLLVWLVDRGPARLVLGAGAVVSHDGIYAHLRVDRQRNLFHNAQYRCPSSTMMWRITHPSCR